MVCCLKCPARLSPPESLERCGGQDDELIAMPGERKRRETLAIFLFRVVKNDESNDVELSIHASCMQATDGQWYVRCFWHDVNCSRTYYEHGTVLPRALSCAVVLSCSLAVFFWFFVSCSHLLVLS